MILITFGFESQGLAQESAEQNEEESAEENSNQESSQESASQEEESTQQNEEQEQTQEQAEDEKTDDDEPNPETPSDEETETPYEENEDSENGEKDTDDSQMKDSLENSEGKQTEESGGEQEPKMTPIDDSDLNKSTSPRYEDHLGSEKEGSEQGGVEKNVEKQKANDEKVKDEDQKREKSQKEKELEKERERWSYGASAYYSRLIDPINTGQSMSYSGNLGRKSEDKTSWSLSLAVSQPLKMDTRLKISSVGWSKSFLPNKNYGNPISISYSGQILGFEQIKSQGYRIHNSASFSQSIFQEGNFSVSARVAPFFLFSEYDQTTGGEDYTLYGASESIGASYSKGDYQMSISTGLQQGYRGGRFKNTNSNSQSLSYKINSSWRTGVSHSISTLVFDQQARSTQPNILLGHAENSLFSFYLSYSGSGKSKKSAGKK